MNHYNYNVYSKVPVHGSSVNVNITGCSVKCQEQARLDPGEV